jgi:hypothetical protein
MERVGLVGKALEEDASARGQRCRRSRQAGSDQSHRGAGLVEEPTAADAGLHDREAHSGARERQAPVGPRLRACLKTQCFTQRANIRRDMAR